MTFAQVERVLVEGEYSYTYGDNESLLEAKNLCYSMALRNAIEGYSIFISSTTTVKNLQLRNDLIQIISSGYLEDLQVLEEKIKGRNIYYKISAFVRPKVVQDILQRKLRAVESQQSIAGIVENNDIKVLSIKKRTGSFPMVDVVVQAKKNVVFANIHITYFDDEGFPIDGSWRQFQPTAIGQIKRISFSIPDGTTSYKVWLPEK